MAPTYITLPNKDRSVLPGQHGTGNYTVKLAETLSFPGDWEAFLVSATIPYTWYNVTGQNNLLVLPGKKVRLTPGNYDTVSTLVAAINKLLGNIGPTVSVDSATMRATITVTNDHTLSGPLLELLGFPAGTKLEAGTHVSPNLVDITGGVNSLLVYVSIIQNTNVGSFQVPLLATIPLGNASPGDIIEWAASGPDYEAHQLNTRAFQSIEVDVRDTHGESIDFNNYDLSIRIGIRKTL
jgi:hypothetical protein